MTRGRTSAALPKHAQISEMLIRDIAAGRLADGARLPPEREMAEQLGIAVGTLRKALETLSNEGLLDRVQGSGNYVRARGGVASIYSMLRLELKAGGGLPTAEFLGVDRLPKPPGVTAFGPSDAGWRFRRLRFLGGVPAALEEIWLDGAQAAEIAAEDVSESLYLFYRERLGLVILSAEDRVSFAPVPDWGDARFPPVAGAAAGYVERIARDSAGAPVEFSRTWFDADTVIYINRIGKA
ncbi:GntR family transcriptional regulator [Antarctobacter sp.]|uniref:GntR family transcriptional regulator n=1 Tax=Antarctobacter sp. TaxID=1872577 RepID=UPI002B26F2E1|nr:GntR family transcriptional regulator [Antarctobacter sp.]